MKVLITGLVGGVLVAAFLASSSDFSALEATQQLVISVFAGVVGFIAGARILGMCTNWKG